MLNISDANHFGIDVVAIHHGVNHKLFRNASNIPSRDEPIFLHISQYQTKKNIPRVLKAFALLKKRVPGSNSKLILVVPNAPEWLRTRAAHQKDVKLITEGLSSQEVAEWFHLAYAFVFPSLHETFGMPIIEGLAAGCPVITSDNSACKEVGDESVILVDPYSIDSIATAMQSILQDEDLRKNHVQKGVERAKAFTWENCARKHFELFRASAV